MSPSSTPGVCRVFGDWWFPDLRKTQLEQSITPLYSLTRVKTPEATQRYIKSGGMLLEWVCTGYFPAVSRPVWASRGKSSESRGPSLRERSIIVTGLRLWTSSIYTSVGNESPKWIHCCTFVVWYSGYASPLTIAICVYLIILLIWFVSVYILL